MTARHPSTPMNPSMKSSPLKLMGALVLMPVATMLQAADVRPAPPRAPAVDGVCFVENGQAFDPLAGQGVALADFNGDGALDAFIVNGDTADGRGYRVWFGDGHGKFADSGQRLPSVDGFFGKPAILDVNGDGSLDRLIGSGYGRRPSEVWINDGRGSFRDGGVKLDIGGGVALGDLDGDGRPDAFVVSIDQWGDAPRGRPAKVYLNNTPKAAAAPAAGTPS
jgi:hypothetical protein